MRQYVTAAVFKSGYMLGSLGNPTLPVGSRSTGDNAMGAGDQQGRPDEAPRRCGAVSGAGSPWTVS